MAEQKIPLPDRATVPITSVFIQYRDVEEDLAGNRRVVVRTAFPAEHPEGVSIPQVEARRLQGLGAVGAATSLEAAVSRALNPLDNRAEGATPAPAQLTVSPPPMGTPASGEFTAGDTGTGDVPGGDPVPPPPGPTTPGGDAGGGTTTAGSGDGFDARGKTVSEVAEWLRAEEPNGTKTVAAAHGDPEAAETLLEAENLVRGGDPRKTVVEPLRKIAESEQGGGGE